MSTVDFCCDFVSPYALAARHGRTVRPVPVLLAALLKQSGALGPAEIADGELFWGCDSLPHLERFLAGDDPLDADAVASFAARVPSATRS